MPLIKPEDFCVIALPVFGGRVPATAVERLQHIRGNGAKAVAVAVYGNRAIDDALVEMEDLLENRGFSVIAGVEAVAEHSIARQFAAIARIVRMKMHCWHLDSRSSAKCKDTISENLPSLETVHTKNMAAHWFQQVMITVPAAVFVL